MATAMLPDVRFQMPTIRTYTVAEHATGGSFRRGSSGHVSGDVTATTDDNDSSATREETAFARTAHASPTPPPSQHPPLTPYVHCVAAPTAASRHSASASSSSSRRSAAARRPTNTTAADESSDSFGDDNDNDTDDGERSAGSRSRTSVDSMELVKLVVLGASSVGKSSIIQQFVWNEFSEAYTPTEKKETYYPSVIINDHLYELKIIDVPVIPYFPVSSLYEWTDFRFYGLRSATAYVLVYDLHSPDTFQYIRTLRDQIFESRDMHNVPVIVVGNKHDACSSRDRRDIVSLVKKQWKCGYIECSAKYNWHIVTMFKELMKTIDYIDYGQKAHSAPRLHGLSGAMQRNKCVIL